MRTHRFNRVVVLALCLGLVGSLTLPGVAQAKTAQEIDASVNAALDRFYSKVRGGQDLVQKARGVLVFAGVIKAGIGIGGEYGEGALRIGGRTNAYYSIAAASIGLQLGAQKKDVIIVFLEDSALRKFQASDGWKVGVDGSVVLIDVGANASIDTSKINEPIVGFVVGQKGLMYNLTLEGSKISKLKK
ncbi:MAG: YSC84-related protein [Armatimonadota bacterium]|nr:YSC84-related protein [Armatimonadota bacterium]